MIDYRIRFDQNSAGAEPVPGSSNALEGYLEGVLRAKFDGCKNGDDDDCMDERLERLVSNELNFAGPGDLRDARLRDWPRQLYALVKVWQHAHDPAAPYDIYVKFVRWK